MYTSIPIQCTVLRITIKTTMTIAYLNVGHSFAGKYTTNVFSHSSDNGFFGISP